MGQFKELHERSEITTDAIKESVLQEARASQLIKDLNHYNVELELQNDNLRSAQWELEEANQRYTSLFNLVPIAYFILNENGLILEVNEAGENLLGIKKRVLIKKMFSRYLTSDSQDQFIHYHKQVLNEKSISSIEVSLLQKSGQRFYAQLNTKVITNKLTKSKELLMSVLDITARKENEKQLQQYQQKLSSVSHNNSLDEFSSIISHELNHPLGVIANYLQGCIRRLEGGKFNIDELLMALKNATQQSHRAAEIILRMKNLKYNGVVKDESICIDSLIKETVTLIKYEISDFPISIHYRPLANALTITIDKVQIQQVILNLARNAIEAMRDANTSNPRLIIEINQFSKQAIEINIIDNGPGFEQDIIHKLFDTHFTTKSYGVGVGLAVSRSIVQSHGGELIIKSNPLGGVHATFTLSLKREPCTKP